MCWLSCIVAKSTHRFPYLTWSGLNLRTRDENAASLEFTDRRRPCPGEIMIVGFARVATQVDCTCRPGFQSRDPPLRQQD